MLSPLSSIIVAKVAGEGLLTPWACGRVGNWSEGGNGSVFAWVFEKLISSKRQKQGLVSLDTRTDVETRLTKIKAPCPPML